MTKSLQDRYDALRETGLVPRQCRQQLGIASRKWWTFENLYHQKKREERAAKYPFASAPYQDEDRRKVAESRYVSAVLAAGGFPTGTGAGYIGPDGQPWRPH